MFGMRGKTLSYFKSSAFHFSKTAVAASVCLAVTAFSCKPHLSGKQVLLSISSADQTKRGKKEMSTFFSNLDKMFDGGKYKEAVALTRFGIFHLDSK